VGSAKAYAGIGAIGFVALIDTSMISPVIASYALSLGADELTASLIATLYSMIAIPIFSIWVHGSPVGVAGRVDLRCP
jgi:hypothetical protein